MNEQLSAEFTAILDRYENGDIHAEQALVEIQIAVANDGEDEPHNKITL